MPIMLLDEFLSKAVKVDRFTSTNGRRYEVKNIKGDIMHFIRIDADAQHDWSFDLKDVYRAYIELENFNTNLFKKYVARRHSPARGLLLHLGLIAAKTNA